MDVWGLPRILGAETVWVQRPEGTELEEMPNPLYRFKFPKEAILKEKKREPVKFGSGIVSFLCHHLTTSSPTLNAFVVKEGSSVHNSEP